MFRKRKPSPRIDNRRRYRKSFLEPLEDRRLLTANFGDAPEPYPVTLADDGARHLASGPRLGDLRGSASNGQHSTEATGNIDDDGVEIGEIRVGQLNSTIFVNVQNAPSGAKLDAWIDFDSDGSWGGSQEIIASGVSVDEGTNVIEFDVPANSVAGTTFARVRLSSAGNLGIGGEAADGEVEDYRVVISSAARGPATFSNAQTISAQALGAFSIATADINGDGNLDVVSAAGNGQQVAWYENNGAESFTQHIVSTAATGRSYVATADLDGDGDVDILSSSMDDNALRWYRNDGLEGFSTSLIGAAGGRLHGLNIVDLDNDGDLDVLAANYDGGSVVLFENDGAEVFHVSTIGDGARMVRGITSADFDNDGDLDIVVGSEEGPKLRWFENNGDEVFVGHDIPNTGDRAMSVEIADVDRDGDADLVAVFRGDDKVAWYENNGSQSFTERIIATNADNVHGLYVGDVDGDGDVDVISASNSDQKVALYENDGSQNFAVSVIANDLPETYAVIVDDLDGDHKLDILSASYNQNKIVWYEHKGGSIAGTVFEDLNTDGVRQVTHFEAFDSDPNWLGERNSSNGNNFGYSLTNHAGGLNAGELGGVFARTSEGGNILHADLLGELNLSNSFYASGKLAITDINNPNNDFRIGFTGPDAQLVFAIGELGPGGVDSSDQPDNTLRVVTRGSFHTTQPLLIKDAIDAGPRNWSMVYDPTAGQFGRLTFELSGPTKVGNGDEKPYAVLNATVDGGTIVVDLTEEMRNSDPTFTNFGIYSHDMGTTENRSITAYFDDLSYGNLTHEPGVNEVTIFVDPNNNNAIDPMEDFTTSVQGSENAQLDNQGTYIIDGLSVGLNAVKTHAALQGFEFPHHVPTFTSYADSAAGNVHGVSAADLDNDGDADFISVDLGSNTTIHLNEGNGQFATQTVNTGNKSVSTALGDLDNDGDIDAIVSVENESRLAILKNDGSGTFSFEKHVDVGSRPRGVDVGDIDNDGLLDIVVANQTSNSVSILVNQDSLSFSKQDLAVGEFPTYVRLGDIDNDSDLDLAVTHQFSDDLRVYRNQGGVSFSSISVLNQGSAPNNLQYIDYDLDNDLDIVTTHPNDNRIRIWPNDGGFSSSAVTSYSVGTFPDGVEVHDINLDGRPDIVTANRQSNDLSVLLNLGGGSFENNSFAIGQRPIYVDVADFNGDGWPDLLAGASGENKAKVGISSGWVTTALVQDGETTRVDLPVMRKPTGSISGHVFHDSNRDGEWQGQRVETFNSDPYWSWNDNRSDGYDYGYSKTNYVDSESDPGEIGGKFARSSHRSYYADTNLASPLTLGQTISARGELDIANVSLNGSVNIGYFNTQSNDQLQLSLLESPESGDHVRAVIQLTTSDGGVYTSLPILLRNVEDGQREWSLEYSRNTDNNSAAIVLTVSGEGTISNNGVGGTNALETTRDVSGEGNTVTVTVPSGLVNENALFNAFGLSAPSLNSPNHSLSIDVFMDNLSYTTGYENRLPAVEVYLDANLNGEFDAGEISTVTMVDDPSTSEINEAGRYEFKNVLVGDYRVRLVEGGKSLSQNPFNTSRSVTVVNGLENQNQDFAVFQNAPRLTLEVPMLIEQIGDDIDGENQGDNDGYKVSVSDDGKTAIVGSWGSAEPGHARVFRYDADNDRWIQKGQTLVGTMAWDLFGSDVAINSDGSIVAVGAQQHGKVIGGDNGYGQVVTFQWNASLEQWQQMGQALEGENAEDLFGAAISMSSDGLSIGIGASRNDHSGNSDRGEVKVFKYNTHLDAWEQSGQDIKGTDPEQDWGRSVSLSTDGEIIAIGNLKSVRLYRLDQGTWSPVGQLLKGPEGGEFGRSLSISGDGKMLAVGIPNYNRPNGGFREGAVVVYSFDKNTNLWLQVGNTMMGDDREDNFGYSVSLSNDGRRLAVGAREADGTGEDSGQAKIYDYDQGTKTWVQFGDDLNGEAPQDRFGKSISLSGDGSTVVVGADNNSGFQPKGGHVRAFRLSNLTIVEDAGLQTVNLTGVTAGPGESDQAVRITAVSSNQDLILDVDTNTISQTNLVAHYPLDGNAEDRSVNGLDGTVHGAVPSVDRFGASSSAYYFDGSNDYIDLGNHPEFNFGTSDFSFSLWFKTDGAQVNKYLLGKYHEVNLPAYGIGTGFGTGSYAFIGDSPGNDADARGDVDLADGDWHHMVTTFDRDGLVTVYIDGEISDTGDISDVSGAISNNLELTIGKISSGRAFGGWIDDVYIYDRSLSLGDVQTLQSGGTNLSFTPEPDQHGTTTITVTVEDGGLDNDLSTTGDNATTSKAFDITISAVNDDPTLDPIADLTIPEDASEQTVNLAGITAGAGELQPLKVDLTNTNSAIADARLISPDSLEGQLTTDLFAHYSLDNTPHDSSGNDRHGTLSDPAKIKPAVDRFGNPNSAYEIQPRASIEVSPENSLRPHANSGHVTYSMWLKPSSDGIVLNQYSHMNVNQSHFFFAVHPDSVVLTGQGTDAFNPSLPSAMNEWHHYVIGYHGQTGDVDIWADGRFIGRSNIDVNPSSSSAQPFRIGFLPNAAANDDQVLIVDDVSVFNRSLSDDEVIELYTRSAVAITPEPNQHGTTTITVTVEDAGLDNDLSTTGDNATFTQTFDVTVPADNDVPTLDPLADVTIDEDASEQTVNLAGITAGGGETQPLRVIATSSNTDLIADPDVSYTSANPTGSLTFAPLADQHGSTTITVTVEDGGLDNDLSTVGDNASVNRTFDVTVNRGNFWHNDSLPEDVNGDGFVSALDALLIINQLNESGASEVPRNRPSDSPMVDVNDDQWLSPQDAIHVINVLNSRNHMVEIGLHAQDLAGNRIKRIDEGSNFYLVLTTEDLREDPKGVFGAYADVYYDTAHLSVEDALEFTLPFVNGETGDLTTAGQIDEWGAFAGLSETGNGELEVSRVLMRAVNSGPVVFGTSAADESPAHDVLVYGTTDTIAHHKIDFSGLEMIIDEVDTGEGEYHGVDETVLDQVSTAEDIDLLELDRFFGQF